MSESEKTEVNAVAVATGPGAVGVAAASGAVPAVVHEVNPENIALILKEIVAEEPEIVAGFVALAPFAAGLKPPFNLIANPLVLKAVNFLPKSLPILTRIAAVLDQIATAQAAK